MEVEIQGETDAHRRNRDVRNQEKVVGWEKRCQKARDKGVMCNSVNWTKRMRECEAILFYRMKGQRQVQQKRPGLNIKTTTKRQLRQVLEDMFFTHRIIAFERYIFICRKQRKNETLKQFHADLVELASRADCGDKEDEGVCDMFTAHMKNEKNAEELLAETRIPQQAYEYAIRRGKGIEHSKTMKLNPIGPNSPVTIKQEPMGYNQPRGGRGGFCPTLQYNNRGKYSRGRQNQNTRGNQNIGLQKYTSQKQCYKCGKPFNLNHLQSCSARDKICTKDAKRGHFAKLSRSDHVNFLQNNTEDESQNENESQPHETEDNELLLRNSRHLTDGRNYRDIITPR